jgi:hypothetical protein
VRNQVVIGTGNLKAFISVFDASVTTHEKRSPKTASFHDHHPSDDDTIAIVGSSFTRPNPQPFKTEPALRI